MKRSSEQSIYPTHKVALSPTPKQESLLMQNAGYARVAYNSVLNDWTQNKKDIPWTAPALRQRWNVAKHTLDWTPDMIQSVGDFAIEDLAKAIAEWGKYRKARKTGLPHRIVGYPKHRAKRKGLSFSYDPRRCKVEARRINIPKIGWVKTREELRFDGKIAKVVIKRDAKRWFACISVQQPKPEETSRRGVVGVDVGIRTLAYTSRGLSYGNPRPLEAALAKLRRLQKAVSRSENINGREWQGYNLTKLRQEISVLHERIANLRNKWHHEIAAEIVAGVGKVRVETLNISGMIRNKRLARALSDAAMGRFLSILLWHCQKNGIHFERIDRWYPSSKMCSACGHVKSLLLLTERIYRCVECGHEMDRDENAALNIENAPTSGGIVEEPSDSLHFEAMSSACEARLKTAIPLVA